MPDLRLSILDQSPIPEGCIAGDALRNSIDLARLADSLGYQRYWVAEHHGTRGLACNSPEVLIGPIAAATSRLRVGSGGVMLPHYSPLKVAENFSMLGGLYPGRIDLGIGRAAGTSPKVAFALQRDRRQAAPDDFREQLDELLNYLNNRMQFRFETPDIWLLGSSQDSAVWAAELGLPYAFADFINPHGAQLARYYRQVFTPSEERPAPRTAVAAWAICAETDEEAERLSLSFRMMMTMLFRGQSIQVPTVEHAQRFLEEEGLTSDQVPVGRRIITGAPARVREAIEAVAKSYEAEEVFIVNILHDHDARRRSYELIAREFGLGVGMDNGVRREF
ncbi:MAG TPA: LLM class flavin-dependent oxidoreductase [Bryobacteraceae bacterium]|jgi:luciferase family oxidoreductase group 1|nr:LLM class flavin-dependent oxidoreductase [Bryobacteraceae bacterium]